MLVAGLVLTALFLLTALFAPLLAPYGFNQLSDASGPFGAQQPPSSQHLLGTTVGGYDVLVPGDRGSRTALYVVVVAARSRSSPGCSSACCRATSAAGWTASWC